MTPTVTYSNGGGTRNLLHRPHMCHTQGGADVHYNGLNCVYTGEEKAKQRPQLCHTQGGGEVKYFLRIINELSQLPILSRALISRALAISIRPISDKLRL